MLKMYQRHAHSGGSPALWEEAWSVSESDPDFADRAFLSNLKPKKFLFLDEC